MWALYAFGSALFAGLTAVLAKCSIRKTDSTVATAIRTIVVLIFSWVMVFLAGSQSQLSALSGRTLLFLILSGLATGASWLCYFHALQIGDINKVVPVDKSSTVLTILLAVIFLHESLSLAKGAGVVLIAAGTYLMIEKKQSDRLADQQGVTTIHLEVRVGNATAIRLYERMGFTRDGIRKGYYSDPVEDALLMTRHPQNNR